MGWLAPAYEALGFDRAAGGDEVFRDLVLARIIEPTSKVDSLRVLAETGVDRHLPDADPPPAGLRQACSCAMLCRRPVPVMPGWDRRRWCSTT